MRIERIELLNFGSYEERNSFDIATEDPKKRIVIIGGKNGAGKTTLFTAIKVCLYGHAAFGYKAAGKLYLKEIFNLINSNARIDESKEAFVTLLFTEDRIDTDHYEVTRRWTWSNTKISEELAVKKNGMPLDSEQLVDFQNYLLHLIPPGLLELYFFDGEKIADYFLSDQHNNIKDALLVLSGNDTYETLYGNIRRLLIGSESGCQNTAQDYADQKDALEKLIASEKQLADDVSELTADIEGYETELEEENCKYTEGGGVSLDQWKDLQRQLKEEEDRREHLNWELKSAAAEVLPFIIVKNLLDGVRNQISFEKELQAYHVLQKAISDQKFQKYLRSKFEATTSIDNAGDATLIFEAIQSYFANAKLEQADPLLMLSDDEVTTVLNKISSVDQYPVSTFAKYRRRIESSISRSKEIRETIQRSSIENFETHIERVTGLAAAIEQAKGALAIKLHDLEEIRHKIEALNKTIDATRKQLEAELKKQSISALSDRVMLLVEELQEREYHRLLAAVEADVNHKFATLIRKSDFVDHIYLDADFTLHLIRNQAIEMSVLKEAVKKHGGASLKPMLKERAYVSLIDQLGTDDERLSLALSDTEKTMLVLPMEVDQTRLSNGEKQILVMALYWAIMNQSHNELPFIIDTPFARIDTEHRANITDMFFRELQGQLFVLSTNEELRREHLVSLEGQIAKIYMLEYGDDKRTRVTEGCYFEV